MTTTRIDTNQCARTTLDHGNGVVAEIINQEICGAQNVTGMLRWLTDSNRFDTESLSDSHQLIYFIEGDGVIELEGQSYDVTQGAGIYLGPAETAGVCQRGDTPTKLLHLIVPRKP